MNTPQAINKHINSNPNDKQNHVVIKKKQKNTVG